MLLWLVPEEEHALCQLLLGILCTENRLKGIGVVAGVPHLGADSHWGGGEVLNLLQLEIEALRDEGETCHIFFMAPGVAADEVGDYLLAQSFTTVNVIKNLLEFLELLAHKAKDCRAGVFGSHLQTPADMAANQFTGVGFFGLVRGLVAAAVQKEVITHTTADKRLRYARQTVHGMVNVEQFAGVSVKIGAYLGMNARWALAACTRLGILARHAIHVG